MVFYVVLVPCFPRSAIRSICVNDAVDVTVHPMAAKSENCSIGHFCFFFSPSKRLAEHAYKIFIYIFVYAYDLHIYIGVQQSTMIAVVRDTCANS